MRKKNKYKIFHTIGLKTKFYYTRVLKFRRPKWLRLQKLYLTSIKNKFINILSIKNAYKTWGRVKKYYKKYIETKNLLYSIYDNSINSKIINGSLSKTLDKRNQTNFILLKPLFRVDILLWKLNFCRSSYEGKQFINNGDVFINGLCVRSNFVLKKGDVLTFKVDTEVNTFFSRGITRYGLSDTFLTFIEVDFYTKTVIVLKNFQDLSEKDFSLIVNEYLNIKNLSYRS